MEPSITHGGGGAEAIGTAEEPRSADFGESNRTLLAETTEAPKLIDGLTPQQRTALKIIIEGQSIRRAADDAGVNRGTVYRWIKADPNFRAAYNAWQVEEVESCRAALLKCAARAVAKIVDQVHYDEALALRVAKELGLFARPKTLRIDPGEVAREIAVEQRETDMELDRRHASATAAEVPPAKACGPANNPPARKSPSAKGASAQSPTARQPRQGRADTKFTSHGPEQSCRSPAERRRATKRDKKPKFDQIVGQGAIGLAFSV